MHRKTDNPFEVKIPKSISAEEAVALFVPEVNGFNALTLAENTFIDGPRGSGKSMMFRYMMPDSQMLVCGSKDCLKYIAVYVPIKQTEINKIELKVLKDQASTLLNEQIMVSYVALMCFKTLSEIEWDASAENIKKLEDFYNSEFKRRIRMTGGNLTPPDLEDVKSFKEVFSVMADFASEVFLTSMDYCNRLGEAFSGMPTYNGPLFSYLNFLDPIISKLRKIGTIPPEIPLYFLIDDADNLSKTQTKILNTWVSLRSYPEVCFKISTQMLYKTRATNTGPTIDNIHDYHSINIANIYTTDTKDNYLDAVTKIVEKRLKHHNLEPNAKTFFPHYEKQEKEIKKIHDSYIEKSKQGKGRGNTPYDDAKRYARPDYIKGLGGVSKQRSSYFYAGFEQLVHLSSGIIRHFLDPATAMFAKMKDKLGESTKVTQITHTIQHNVVKEYADRLLFIEFDEIMQDVEDYGGNIDNIVKLRNLVNALGGMFSEILLSNASERRVFSIALQNDPDREVREILKLGVQYGYLHESTIGNKEGTGRTRRYILNRSLAPVFKLDPTSFSGYKFITSDALRVAIHGPQRFVRNVRKKLKTDPEFDFQEKNQKQEQLRMPNH